MNGLYVVTLLDRQRSAQQQFSHAQHTVHGRADFMADPGEKLGLGVDLCIARGQCAAGTEARFSDGTQALTDGHVQQQATERGQPEQDEQ